MILSTPKKAKACVEATAVRRVRVGVKPLMPFAHLVRGVPCLLKLCSNPVSERVYIYFLCTCAPCACVRTQCCVKVQRGGQCVGGAVYMLKPHMRSIRIILKTELEDTSLKRVCCSNVTL